ncbi:MAG: ATP-binding protein [Rhodospirillaceae bacterium]
MYPELSELLTRIAEILERLAPKPARRNYVPRAEACVWIPAVEQLKSIEKVNRIPLTLLQGISSQSEILLSNTQNHADGLPANNALLWGARGTGKSSLIKAVHAEINKKRKQKDLLVLVEIHREDISSLPHLLDTLRPESQQFVIFCDDLTFEATDDSYKSLKAVLEGGLEGRPSNIVFYATSNRRHMMARNVIENEKADAIYRTEAVEEQISLSDRFGLWIGFHHIDQDTYFNIVETYAAFVGLNCKGDSLKEKAIQWSATRGSRSGRVAWQFIQHLAGLEGINIRID